MPRIRLSRLDRQRHLPALPVHIEHFGGDLLAHLDDLGRVINVLPGQLRHVYQTIDPTEVHEPTWLPRERNS